MLTKDDLTAIVDVISPLIDARAKTTETLMKTEIRAEILAARAEAKADMLNLSSKVIKRENEQDKRLDALEKEAGVSNPNKN